MPTVSKPPTPVCQEADRKALQHTARLDWLRARPALLGRLPDAGGEPDADQAEALDEVLRAMKLVKLYGPALAPGHVRASIRLLVHELRA